MYYTDSMEQSSEYLRLALDHMGRFNIPVDPINYTVWYEYVSGKNEALQNAINNLLNHEETITVQMSKDLYKRYILDENQSIIENVRMETRRILAEILKQIMENGGDLTRYEGLLENYSEQLSDSTGIQDIRRIVDNIIAETKTMEESGSLFKKRLFRNTSEIEALRKNLEKVKKQSTTDALTGLYNRRAFDTAMNRHAKHATQTGQRLCLLMADIDHFKSINDNYGHLVGDNVLRITAEMLKRCVKGKDIVARYGGDEFMILLPDTPLNGALTLAENIRSYFETTKIKRKDTGKIIGTLTLSFGVALYDPGETIDTFIQRLDKAMYHSKENGRNRVTNA